jgi:lipid-binding SYLF domain-containing protein
MSRAQFHTNLTLAITCLALAACSHSEAQPAPHSPAESSAKADEKERLADSVELLKAFQHGVAEPVLKRARCVALVPDLLSGGLIVGARHGHGFATCRVGDAWSAPAPITISGASFGPQIGVQSVDWMMLVMTDEGLKKMLRAKLTLGADMSVSAGPVGKGKEIDTDTALKTEALSFSRSRGLFAGVDLNGAAVEQDVEATTALYGQPVEFQRLLTGEVKAPLETHELMATVGETF